MANDRDFYAVDPGDPTPGTLGVLVPADRANEMAELEKERQVRVWTVRGIVSNHIPLIGTPEEIIAARPVHRLYLNENPLLIYLHRGGRDATYYEFVADSQGLVEYIEVRVETDLPSNAFLLAWKPLNELLDAIVRGLEMPWLYQRLELISPRDQKVLAYQMVLPFRGGLKLGPLGGLTQWPPFATYDAIFREAVISTSPFYRFLCACRVYEGTNSIRKWLKQQCERFQITEKLPSDPEVDPKDLENFRFPKEFAEGVRTAADLFQKRFSDLRNAIAHFLIEGDEGTSHIYLADGGAIMTYAYGSALLLKYARRTIDELRDFYKKHLDNRFTQGSILPMPEIRDRFIVRDPQLPDKN